MGKQSHRKRQQKKKGPTSGKPTTKSSPTSPSSASSGSLILQRLRHADPRTRHAALSALSTTILDPDTLSSPHRSAAPASTPFLSISTDVLQAIRERIMDDDLECAQAAAGCLNNYVSFCPAPKQDICAGWTVILVGRLQQCRDILLVQQQASQQASTTTAVPPKLKLVQLQQWMALTVQCLQTLCALIENNPLAVERIHQQYSTTSDVLQVLLDLLSMAITQQSQHDEGMVVSSDAGADMAVASAAPDSNNSKQLQQQQDAAASISSMLRTIATYAARTLHSALDDNSDLLLPWLLSSNTTAKAGLQLLQQCCAISAVDSSPKPPAAAQLHCAGCLVTARQQVIVALAGQSIKSQIAALQSWADTLQNAVLTAVVPLLQQLLQSYDTVQSQTLLDQYVQAKAEYEQEVADSQLERDVIRQVEQRHEPARSIARRQKAMKEQQGKKGEEAPAKDEAKDNDDDEKMQDNDAEDATPKGDDKVKSNRREAMEGARQAFHSSLVPLQLALEITANLTTPSNAGADDENDDAMDDDDDDDDNNQPENNPVALADGQLMDNLVERSVPDQVLALLRPVCLLPTTATTTPVASSSSSEPRLPNDAMEEMAGVISKCAACLGNCLANLPWERIPSSTVWTTLQQCMTTLASSSLIHHSTDAIDGLWTVMAVAVKSHDSIRKLVRHEDVEWLLTQLSAPVAPSTVGQREIVAMLGVWCREELHPSELNHKVCQALVSLLASSDSSLSSLMLTNEVLNALMDMYGNDDHGQVFDSLSVLGHLQRTVPVFQLRLQHAQEEPELLDLWNETAMNTERFILYKKSS